MNPIRLVTLAFQPDKKLALKKREMEKRLRAGGLSRSDRSEPRPPHQNTPGRNRFTCRAYSS